MEYRRLFAVTTLALLAIASFGKDRPDYQVGIFVGKNVKDDGSLVSTSGGYSKGVQQGHYTYAVQTDAGSYVIEAPTAVVSSIFASLATNGQSANIHKDSFLDTLHEGDKVLFSPKCDKHRRCSIRMPDPDNPKKIVNTVGGFWPKEGKSNVTALCGSGKLSQTIENEYCARESSKIVHPNGAEQPINTSVAQNPGSPNSDQAEPEPTLAPEVSTIQTALDMRAVDTTSAAVISKEGYLQEVTAEISSTPLGAEIEIDDAFVGNTPSSVAISTGDHTIRISKAGYMPWVRMLRSSPGSINVVAMLELSSVSERIADTASNTSLGANHSTQTESPVRSQIVARATTSLPARESSFSSAAEETAIGVWFTGKPTVRHDGVQISGVQPDGPADSIDMKPGDWILAIDGHFLYTIDELRAELRRYKPDTRLRIHYRREQLMYDNSIVPGHSNLTRQ